MGYKYILEYEKTMRDMVKYNQSDEIVKNR